MIGVVIQARSGSTRLPNKMNLNFHNGHTILEIIIARIQRDFSDLKIVLATTNSKKDDALLEKIKPHNIDVFRGSEDDVLDRFIKAAEHFGFRKIIRICADNPFLDMESLRVLINTFSSSMADYMSFETKQGIPSIKTHFGFWAEAVKLSALKKVQDLTNEKFYLEHVTNYIYEHPKYFKTEFLAIPEYLNDTQIRLTIDTKADFEITRELYNEVAIDNKHDFAIKEIYNKVIERGDWLKIMSGEIKKQKK